MRRALDAPAGRLLAGLPSLASLAADALIRVANPFALVRLWFADTAHARGFLTHELLVNTLHRNLVVAFDQVGNTCGWIEPHDVGVADLQDQHRTIFRGTVADAGDFEILLEARRDADDHVVQQRARE